MGRIGLPAENAAVLLHDTDVTYKPLIAGILDEMIKWPHQHVHLVQHTSLHT